MYKSYCDKQKKGCYFKVTILKAGKYSLQVDKTPERFFEDKRQNDYSYPNAVLGLGIFNNGQITQKLQGVSSTQRTLSQSYDLQPGNYIVSVKVDFDPKYEVDYDVNLAVYA